MEQTLDNNTIIETPENTTVDATQQNKQPKKKTASRKKKPVFSAELKEQRIRNIARHCGIKRMSEGAIKESRLALVDFVRSRLGDSARFTHRCNKKQLSFKDLEFGVKDARETYNCTLGAWDNFKGSM